MLALCRKSAAASTAASTVAGIPSMSASGYRCSAVWYLKCASPRLQAFLALTIRSPSACSSMSSHTQPQKVHVAFLTTVRLILFFAWLGLGSARTGRHDERSAKLPSAEAPADAARLVPSGFDGLPGRDLIWSGLRKSKIRGWLAFSIGFWNAHRSFHFVPASGSGRLHRQLGRDRLDFDFPALRGGHSGSITHLTHDMASRRSIWDENHSLGNLAFNALESRLAPCGPNANSGSRRNADGLHILGMHVHGPHGGPVIRVVLARADLLALPGRAAHVHDKALVFHRDGVCPLVFGTSLYSTHRVVEAASPERMQPRKHEVTKKTKNFLFVFSCLRGCIWTAVSATC